MRVLIIVSLIILLACERDDPHCTLISVNNAVYEYEDGLLVRLIIGQDTIFFKYDDEVLAERISGLDTTLYSYVSGNLSRIDKHNSYCLIEGNTEYYYKDTLVRITVYETFNKTVTQGSFVSIETYEYDNFVSIETYEYDNRINPFYGLPEYWFETEHNITKITFTNSKGSLISEWYYSYEYNEYGYPVKRTLNTGNDPVISEFTYDCK